MVPNHLSNCMRSEFLLIHYGRLDLIRPFCDLGSARPLNAWSVSVRQARKTPVGPGRKQKRDMQIIWQRKSGYQVVHDSKGDIATHWWLFPGQCPCTRLFIDRGIGQTDSSCCSKGSLGSFRRKLGAEWCDAARILRGELFESFCRYLHCILTATFITRL
jgi:hypothetical protein